MTLWRCVSEQSWFLCSGPWILLDLGLWSLFCDLFCDLLRWSLFCASLLYLCPLFISVSCFYSAAPEIGCLLPGKKTPCPRVWFPVLGLLRFQTTRLLKNSYPLSSNAHIWCNMYFGSRCVGNTIYVTIFFLSIKSTKFGSTLRTNLCPTGMSISLPSTSLLQFASSFLLHWQSTFRFTYVYAVQYFFTLWLF
jgi:hypothetical protein